MKNMKKFASVALVLVMTIALMVPVMAAPGGTEGGNITIENAVKDQVYRAYKILDVESINEAGQSYKINSAWTGFFAEGQKGYGFVEELQDGFVSWNREKDGELEQFAKDALAYAESNNIAPVKTETAEADGEIKFTGLELGYYLIDSTVGTLCELRVSGETVTIQDKNEKPTIEKKTTNNTENTQRVGEDIEYQVTVHAKHGAENYVLTDTMGAGLKFNQDSIVVKVGETALIEDTDYTVTPKDEHGFTLSFAKTYLDKVPAEGQDIVVAYSAKITADAVTVDTVKNSAVLKFGDPEHTEETKPAEVESEVFKFNFVKHDSENKGLEGAVFSLHTENSCTDDNRLGLVSTGENSYRVATEEDAAGDIVYTVTTPADGKITIDGLGNKTYYLKEITAPEGYNLLKDPVEVAFNGADIETSFNTETKVWDGIGILNLTGAELPSTGGIGTTIFYIVGGALVVGAAILLVTRKRVKVEQ